MTWEREGRQRNPIKRDLIASSHHIRIIHLAISSRPSATARFATEATEFAIRERTALASLLCDESNISPSIDTRTRVGRLSRSGLGKLAGLQFKQETSSSVRGKKERKKERIVACVADAATEIRSFSDPATSHA